MKRYLSIISIIIFIIACESESISTNSLQNVSNNPLIGEWDLIESQSNGFAQGTLYNFNQNDIVFKFLNDSIVSVVTNVNGPLAESAHIPINFGLMKYRTEIIPPGASNLDTITMFNTMAWAPNDFYYENKLYNYEIESNQNDTTLTFSSRFIMLNGDILGAAHNSYAILKKR